MENTWCSSTEENDFSETHDVLYAEDYIVIDVETTGMDAKQNKIIQLAMIKVKNSGEVETWSKYFNPCMRRELQLKAFKIHKISPDVLLRKKTFKDHYHAINEFLGDVKYLVGHNILFDWNFLYKEISLASAEYNGDNSVARHLDDIILIDTYKMSISSFPQLTTFNLQHLAKYLQLETFRQPVLKYGLCSPSKKKKEVIEIVESAEPSFHDAMTDTMVTKELFDACIDNLPINLKFSTFSLNDLEKHYRQFTYPVRFIFDTDKLLNGTLDSTERPSLVEYAEYFMSSLPYTRGKLLKDISKKDLLGAISYLDSSQNINLNDKRLRALMDLLLEDELSDIHKHHESIPETKRKESTGPSKITQFFPQKKARLSEEGLQKDI